MATTFRTATWAVAAVRRGAAVVCDAPVSLFVEIVALSASLPLGEHIVLRDRRPRGRRGPHRRETVRASALLLHRSKRVTVS
jgi:hypothetical protein